MTTWSQNPQALSSWANSHLMICVQRSSVGSTEAIILFVFHLHSIRASLVPRIVSNVQKITMATKCACNDGSSACYEACIERYKQQRCIREILRYPSFSHPPESGRAAISIKCSRSLRSRSIVVTCVLCLVAFTATGPIFGKRDVVETYMRCAFPAVGAIFL
jgi:hypothetical protein